MKTKEVTSRISVIVPFELIVKAKDQYVKVNGNSSFIKMSDIVREALKEYGKDGK